ncbi:BfmA/BtgA family mobilization protein [Confluentibacter sediminis]|uniref:BfmA/BtgA family mobilization protein n=1 Tax=Confluentibacter sediminis TaxID=2219045 RepID=UPI000DACCBF8|nr:BfmA/BtgA family mobilization protein [Confluentibacter sediminis]
MDDFNTIRLKKKTIDKFKKYSKKISPSYSETLDFMIAFFQDNNISPYDTLRVNFSSLPNILNKRMDAVVSILRKIEETQLKPTKKMLESLFEEMEEKEEPMYIDRTQEEIEASKTETEKLLDYYSVEYDKSREELHEIKNEFSNLLNELSYIKNTFGRSYYRLDIPKEKIEDMKSRLF